MGDIGMWFQLICVLVAVIALAYLVLHKGLGTLMKFTQTHKQIQISERVTLDHKRALYLVKVENRRFLLGGGESGVSLIAELEGNSDGNTQS